MFSSALYVMTALNMSNHAYKYIYKLSPPGTWAWAVRPQQSRILFCRERGRNFQRRNKIFKDNLRTCFVAYILTVLHRLYFLFAQECSHIVIWAIFKLNDDWALSMPFPWYLSWPMR